MTEMLQKSENVAKNVANENSQDLTEQWVNIYKSKKHGSYWSGAFCYKTKEEAVKDLADKENYLTTVNIEDMLNLQTQNAQLKELLKEVKDYLPEFETPMDILAKIDEALR